MTEATIDEKVMEIRALDAEIEQLKSKVDAIKDELKQELTDRGVETVSTGMFKVTYKTIESNRFDSKAFKKDNEALYEAYLKPSTSTRLTIK